MGNLDSRFIQFHLRDLDSISLGGVASAGVPFISRASRPFDLEFDKVVGSHCWQVIAEEGNGGRYCTLCQVTIRLGEEAPIAISSILIGRIVRRLTQSYNSSELANWSGEEPLIDLRYELEDLLSKRVAA